MITNPTRPIVIIEIGNEMIRDDPTDRRVDEPEDQGQHDDPVQLALIGDHVERGVLGQGLGQDVERDRGDDGADDEASQGGASE